jgi:hypothetical protein
MLNACGEWAHERSPVSAQAVARGAARCASQVLDRGAYAVAVAPLVERRRYLIAAPRPLPAAPLVVCRRYLIVVPRPLSAAPLAAHRRYLIVVPRPLPAAPRRCRSRRRLTRHITSEESKYYRHYLYSGKVTPPAMYFRRVRVVGRSFAAALTNFKPLLCRLRQLDSKRGLG